MTLHEYADVFSETAFDSLPEHRKWDHAIELEREPSPGFQKVYPMTLTEQTEMDAFLEEALATGHIRQSKSPLRAPVFFIKKKDGKLRFVQDYRALNAITRKNWYPLPLIDDLIHPLRGARYFTKLDVQWGYNCLHPRRRPVEGRILHEQRFIRAPSHVLQPHIQPGHLLDHDERDIPGPDHQRHCLHVSRRHSHIHQLT
jgi:hypothetical protein